MPSFSHGRPSCARQCRLVLRHTPQAAHAAGRRLHASAAKPRSVQLRASARRRFAKDVKLRSNATISGGQLVHAQNSAGSSPVTVARAAARRRGASSAVQPTQAEWSEEDAMAAWQGQHGSQQTAQDGAPQPERRNTSAGAATQAVAAAPPSASFTGDAEAWLGDVSDEPPPESGAAGRVAGDAIKAAPSSRGWQAAANPALGQSNSNASQRQAAQGAVWNAARNEFENGTTDPWLTVPSSGSAFVAQVQRALENSMLATGATPEQPEWHARVVAFWGSDDIVPYRREDYDPSGVTRLKEATSWREVTAVLDSPGKRDAVELCTALHTLSHLYGRKIPTMPADAYAELQDLVTHTLYRLLVEMRRQPLKKRQQTVSNAIYSVARLYLPVDACAFQMLCDIGMSVAAIANCQAVANMRFALTLLGAVEGAGKELADALAARSLALVRACA